MAWNRYENERRSRGYGAPDYDRYGRSEPRDRGMVERGADDARSWFGDEEAEQRRRREMREDREFQEGRGYRDSQSARGSSSYAGPGEYGNSGTRPTQSGRSPDWRDIDGGEENDYQTGRNRSAQRSGGEYLPATFRYAEIWAIPGPHVGHGPRGYQRSDERIKEDVCECLAQHGMIDARNIDVTVENGEVTLRGSVDDRQMKRRAEDAVESVSGVRDVHNEIRVGAQESNTGNQSGRQSKSKSAN